MGSNPTGVTIMDKMLSSEFLDSGDARGYIKRKIVADGFATIFLSFRDMFAPLNHCFLKKSLTNETDRVILFIVGCASDQQCGPVAQLD